MYAIVYMYLPGPQRTVEPDLPVGNDRTTVLDPVPIVPAKRTVYTAEAGAGG